MTGAWHKHLISIAKILTLHFGIFETNEPALFLPDQPIDNHNLIAPNVDICLAAKNNHSRSLDELSENKRPIFANWGF